MATKTEIHALEMSKRSHDANFKNDVLGTHSVKIAEIYSYLILQKYRETNVFISKLPTS